MSGTPSSATPVATPPPGPPPLLGARCALLLDFDGTLVELAPRPNAVVVPHRLPRLLERLLLHLDGAVGVITGRWLADVDGLLSPLALRGAGVHGAELRLHETTHLAVCEVPGIGNVASALRLRFGDDTRVLVEDKGAAVALHWRLAPERANECISALRELVAPHAELETLLGNMVIEARTRGVHKGVALARLMASPAFAGRMPVFVGDDATDEDAFAIVAELGGFGVKVGAGPTRAVYRCESVAHVHEWLAASLEDRHG